MGIPRRIRAVLHPRRMGSPERKALFRAKSRPPKVHRSKLHWQSEWYERMDKGVGFVITLLDKKSDKIVAGEFRFKGNGPRERTSHFTIGDAIRMWAGLPALAASAGLIYDYPKTAGIVGIAGGLLGGGFAIRGAWEERQLSKALQPLDTKFFAALPGKPLTDSEVHHNRERLKNILKRLKGFRKEAREQHAIVTELLALKKNREAYRMSAKDYDEKRRGLLNKLREYQGLR